MPKIGTVKQLRRDPFARETLMSEEAGDGVCTWCGRVGSVRVYWWEGDADTTGRGRRFASDKTFCSAMDHRIYHS